MGRKYHFPEETRTALVTGGGGFVGQAVVDLLLNSGLAVRSLSRRSYPGLVSRGVAQFQGDLADSKVVDRAVAGSDLVFHVAALPGIWGKYQHYERTNYTGTANIIEACGRHGVPALVYTSTPSVVFAGEDICGADERIGYAEKYLCAYPRTKMLAEKLVLAADSSSLRTCALRPHLIWGPGDPNLLPRLVLRGRQKKLLQVGDGRNLVDLSYIDNVAHAHLLAAMNLLSSGECGGKPYFISDGEPVNLWQWINELFARLDIPRVSRTISFPVAYRLGAVMEAFAHLSGRQEEPRMTRFLAEQLARSHYFSIDRARADFQYEPLLSSKESMERTITWLQQQEI